MDMGRGNFFDPEGEKAVGKKDGIAFRHFVRKPRIGNRDDCFVSDNILGREGEGCAVFQHDRAVLESADAVLRTLGIQQNGNRKIEFFPHFFERVYFFLMIFMGTVGEIEAGDVHPREAEFAERIFPFAGGADGTDDLCFAHNVLLCPEERFFRAIIQQVQYNIFSRRNATGTDEKNDRKRSFLPETRTFRKTRKNYFFVLTNLPRSAIIQSVAICCYGSVGRAHPW